MRTLLTLSVVVLVVAWADAQQTNMLSAADRVKHVHANRGLLEKLVNHSVAISKVNDSVSRSAACRAAMGELTLALDAAIDAQDANRVAELGDHYNTILNEGLIPTLEEASHQVPATSAEYPRLKFIHQQATEELTRLELSVPQIGTLIKSGQVKEMLAKWKQTAAQLATMFKPAPQGGLQAPPQP